MRISKEIRNEVKRILTVEKNMNLTKSRWEADKNDENSNEKIWAKMRFYNNAPEMVECIKNLLAIMKKK